MGKVDFPETSSRDTLDDPSYNYQWSVGDDVIVQLIYQLELFPDSCIAKDVEYWYNSLYSELSAPAELPKCHPPEYCETPSNLAFILGLLAQFATGTLLVALEPLIASRLAALGLPAARRVLFQFSQRINRRVVEQIGATVD